VVVVSGPAEEGAVGIGLTSVFWLLSEIEMLASCTSRKMYYTNNLIFLVSHAWAIARNLTTNKRLRGIFNPRDAQCWGPLLLKAKGKDRKTSK